MEQMNVQHLEDNLSKAVKHLQSNFAGLRTNVVSPDFLSPVQVEAHGQMVQLKAVASITLRDSQTLHVQVWDKSIIREVEKGIRDSNLNVNPTLEGDAIFVRIPPLTQERRKELVKTMKEYKERAKISIRNNRHDIIALVKKSEKDKEISEDEAKKSVKNIDEIVKKHITEVDKLSDKKEKDIMG